MTKLNSKIAKASLGLIAGASMLLGAASAMAATFNSNLTVGSRGAEVSALQTMLGVTPVSGYFGNVTKAAVKAFQVAHSITPASGYFGPLTRTVANAMGTTGGTSTVPGCVGTTGFSPTTGASCAGNTGSTGTQTGPVTVMLATDNPAAGTIVAGQATADLAHFTFTGSGTVNSVTLSRGGISNQNTLSNIYLYDGINRLTDGYSFNSNGTVTINVPFMVNGSKTIAVKADVSVADYSVSVALTGFTSGTTANTVNIKGNEMYIAAGSTLASIVNSGSANVSAATVNAGTSSYAVWRQSFTVNTRTLWLKVANFRVTGSAPVDALSNVYLYVDGVKTGAAGTMMAMNGSNYITFDATSAPMALTTGNHTLEVRGDVQKGSSYNLTVALQQASDLVVYDPQVGVNLAVCGTTGGTACGGATAYAFTSLSGGLINIAGGSSTMVIDPTFNSMTNVTGGASGATIAKFKIHGYGEDVKVSSLSFLPVLTSCTPTCAGLQNVTLYFNGSQVGSQSSWTSGNLTPTLGSQLIIPAGADSTLEIRADLRTTGGVNYTAGSVSATVNAGSGNAEGQTSHASASFPVSSQSSNTLTIQTGTLGLSKNTGYASQVQNPNTAGVKIGSFVLQNNSSSESVRVTSLAVALGFATPTYTSGTVTTGSQSVTFSSTTGMTAGNIITIPGATAAIGTITSITSGTVAVVNFTTGGLTPTVGGAVTGSGATSLATVTNFGGLRTSENPNYSIQPQATNTFSTDFTLAAGATKIVDIFADTSSANMGYVQTTLTVTSLGVTSSVTATSSAVAGQVITLSTGTVGTPTLLTATSTSAQYIAAGDPAMTGTGATDGTKASYNFVSTGGSATISELKFTVTGTDTVMNIRVGSVSAPVVSNIAWLQGLTLAVPNGGAGLSIDAMVTYAPVGTSGTTPGTTSAVALTYVKYTSGGATATLTPTVTAPTMIMVGSKPTVVVNTSTVSGLNLGAENKIGEVTITADAKGNIKINDLKFSVSNTGFTTVPTFTLARIADGTTTVTSSSCGQGTAAAASQTIFCEFADAGTMVTTTGVADVESNSDFDGYTIAAGTSKTLSLYATVSAANTGTNLAQISTSLNAAGFNWDDASTNGGAGSTGLTGSSIYNFPTGSYTARQ